ncbi:MAG: tetratricopeptide repeat protein [Steroidobacteraceae bacterium]
MNSATLSRATVTIGVLLALAACSTIQPYSAPTAPATPPPVYAPEAPAVEIQPVSPTISVEPAQPLPPANTRTYSLNAASRALVNQAETQRKSKNFVQAAATLERALRIEPNNPLLWLAYGELRMDEGNYAQAENMGRKAVASATGDPRTQANAWRLIADSFKARDKNTEAQQAYARANALMGR